MIFLVVILIFIAVVASAVVKIQVMNSLEEIDSSTSIAEASSYTVDGEQ